MAFSTITGTGRLALRKPIWLAPYSVNQMLPLVSKTRSKGAALAVGADHCAQVPLPVGTNSPIALLLGSVNQTFPLASTATKAGLEYPDGSENVFTSVPFAVLYSLIEVGNAVAQSGTPHPGSATKMWPCASKAIPQGSACVLYSLMPEANATLLDTKNPYNRARLARIIHTANAIRIACARRCRAPCCA